VAIKAIYVPLSPDELDGLRTVGQSEQRDIRRQAARFIREGLERVGALNDQKSAGSPDRRPAA
jgi:hypothetical protein